MWVKMLTLGRESFFVRAELHAHHSLSGPILTHPCSTVKIQKSADYSLTDHRQWAGGKHKACQFPSRVPLATP